MPAVKKTPAVKKKPAAVAAAPGDIRHGHADRPPRPETLQDLKMRNHAADRLHTTTETILFRMQANVEKITANVANINLTATEGLRRLKSMENRLDSSVAMSDSHKTHGTLLTAHDNYDIESEKSATARPAARDDGDVD
jgi:hypothetical protein